MAGTRSSAVTGLDQAGVRRVNTSAVMRALASHTDEATLASLGEQTALSRRTVELIVAEGLAEGWAREAAGTGSGGAGRPARRFRFVADHRLVAGLRIDTHQVHAVVADLHGGVRGRSSAALGAAYADPRATVERAGGALRAALAEAATSSPAGTSKVVAGGVASGGVVDPDDGVVRRLVNAPAWTGFPLAAALGDATGVEWVADNDANLAALAEHWSGAAAGRRYAAWLVHGHRTGAGFTIDGRLHRGAGGAAGELIESRVLGIARDPHQLVGMLSSPVRAERARAAEVLAAAAAGDGGARSLAEEFAAEVAGIIDVLTWTIAPELVVLGGGLEDGAEVLVPLVHHALQALGSPAVEVVPTAIGQQAPLQGAVRTALLHVDTALYGPVVS